MSNRLCRFLAVLLMSIAYVQGANQTPTVSPVIPEDNTLPFTLEIDLADFSLPAGLQSYAGAIYKGKWFLITGRTSGLHGFVAGSTNNFPIPAQNTMAFVIDPDTGQSWSRELNDPSSGLSQAEIDPLSTTAAQYFQKKGGNLLYVVGGYGWNTATSKMITFDTLTEINLDIMIPWVMNGGTPNAQAAIRQTSDPFLRVTGGFLFQATDNSPMLLMLGHDFEGFYTMGVQNYTNQIRTFQIQDNGTNLTIVPNPSSITYPDYRRRDLNIVPILKGNNLAYVAFAGVFTPSGGAWTVPITIFPNGASYELNPQDPSTFKQAMNQYICASFGLYSSQRDEMYVVFPGGISYGFFSNGTFQTDAELPFINQVTTIKIGKNNRYTQYLMNAKYPYMTSTGSMCSEDNQLLFGSSAQFFYREDIPLFSNEVIQFDAIPKVPTVIGYIVGGIMSKCANTSSPTDSTSCPFVFTVTLIPKCI